MYLEERVAKLENQVALLTEALEKQRKVEEWATPDQLAETMKVSVDTIYRKIQKRQIIADRSTGRIRIPMSQFSREEPGKAVARRTEMQKLIFGEEPA